MQLPVKTEPQKKIPLFSEQDLKLEPPNVVKPKATDRLAMYREFQVEIQPNLDLVRAGDVRRYMRQLKDDRDAYVSWLEAFTQFPDVIAEHPQTVKSYKTQDGRIVKYSGTPCLPLPRIEKRREVRADGSVRRKRVKVNNPSVVFLEAGDFWGPHSGDQRPPTTRLKHEEALERSNTLREEVKQRRKHLSVVEDKGPYKGPHWKPRIQTQGFEGWPRPPSLLDLFADLQRKLAKCSLKSGVFQCTIIGKDGVPTLQERLWTYRDGSELCPTPMDNHSKQWLDDGTSLNHGLVTEKVAAVIGEPILDQCGTPITPLQEKLEIGTEVISFRSISRMDDLEVKWLGKVKFREKEVSSSLKAYPELRALPPPQEVIRYMQMKDTARFKQSEGYRAYVEEKRWAYPVDTRHRMIYRKGVHSDRTLYLYWLEKHSVLNGEKYYPNERRMSLGRLPMGPRKDWLLAKTLGVEEAFSLTTDLWYWDMPDDKRYEEWFDRRGESQVASQKQCIHTPAPDHDWSKVNIVDRLDYDRMKAEEPLSQEELDEWMDSVAARYERSYSEEAVREFALRTGVMTADLVQHLKSTYKVDPESGLYVPPNMEIIRPDREEILRGHIEQFYWKEYAGEKRAEIERNKPVSLFDSLIDGMKSVFRRE